MMKIKCIFIVLSCVVFFSCSVNSLSGESESDPDKSVLTFACWNTQTFFDAEVDGVEYDDFKNLSKWSREKYITRLGRLCEVMTSLNPDIFVLEEIESQSVVQDIANQLSGSDWNRNNTWRYACFAKETNSAIGCAVFSKYELSQLKTHSVCVKSQKESQPSMRPVIEVSVIVDEKKLVIFANHWKSKLGNEDSEIWRDWQEFSCAYNVDACISGDAASVCVLCGDFNRDATEFLICQNGSGKCNTKLRTLGKCVELYSPWFTDSGSLAFGTGSYYYNGNWERIDNILVSSNVHLSAFSARAQIPWAKSNCIPNEYSIYTGEGYSDHLPLMCVLTF